MFSWIPAFAGMIPFPVINVAAYRMVVKKSFIFRIWFVIPLFNSPLYLVSALLRVRSLRVEALRMGSQLMEVLFLF